MWRRGILLNLLLLIVSGLLFVSIIRVWWGEKADRAESLTQEELHVPVNPIWRTSQPLATYNVVVQKNLFSPDRREPTETSSEIQTDIETGKLLGTIIIGSKKLALIALTMAPGGEEVRIVRLGEKLGNLEVVKIDNKSVTLEGAEGRKVLNFSE